MTLYLCYFLILVLRNDLTHCGYHITFKFPETTMSVCNIKYKWCVSAPRSSLKQGGRCLWLTTWFDSFFFPLLYNAPKGEVELPGLTFNTVAAFLFSWRTNPSFSVCSREHSSTEINRILSLLNVLSKIDFFSVFFLVLFLKDKLQRLNFSLYCHHMVTISNYS